LQQWQDIASNSFLRGYQEAVGDAVCQPQDPEVAQSLLRLFLIEKALYEIRYELENRPGWVTIPLNGLLRLLREG